MTHETSINQEFLNRIITIVEANMGDEHFGVEQLAIDMGMSRSQLHRKLKSITNKSISQFIREQRLLKAMEMLQMDMGTASEIAYKVGFGSPSYFNKCFHKYFGFPPGEARRRQVNENLKNKPLINASFSYIQNRRSLPFKMLWGIAVCAFFVLLSVIYTHFTGDTMIRRIGVISDKSIAVLPFKNLSSEEDSQYFADGMMEDILVRLTNIHDLKVISRSSSNHYRGTTKPLPQIADELGVAFVLEGSVQKSQNKARVFVQLIDANSDFHIWSQKYDVKFDNLLPMQADIAKHIAHKLEAVITPREIKQVEKRQTLNTEAYNLYLQGRFFWNKRDEEGLKTSLHYFERSIAQDSTYALAYAGMADAYFIMSWWGWVPTNEGYTKAKEYAMKALSIDENLAEAHASLGAIAHWYQRDLKKAQQELLKAIDLNSNYANARQYYAEYLFCVGKIDEAIEQMNKALELDPLSSIMYSISGCLHFQAGYFEKSISLHNTVLKLNKNFRYAHIDLFYIYIEQDKIEMAFEELKKYLKKDSVDVKYIPSIEKAYAESGKKGLLQGLIDLQLAKNAPEAYFIAELFSKLGQKDKALYWLERSYESRENIIWMRIKDDRNMKNISSHPRYRAIIKKMKLDDI